MTLLKKIRLLVLFFIIALILSGVTAFPVETELKWLLNHPALVPNFVKEWLQNVYAALVETNAKYPMDLLLSKHPAWESAPSILPEFCRWPP